MTNPGEDALNYYELASSYLPTYEKTSDFLRKQAINAYVQVLYMPPANADDIWSILTKSAVIQPIPMAIYDETRNKFDIATLIPVFAAHFAKYTAKYIIVNCLLGGAAPTLGIAGALVAFKYGLQYIMESKSWDDISAKTLTVKTFTGFCNGIGYELIKLDELMKGYELIDNPVFSKFLQRVIVEGGEDLLVYTKVLDDGINQLFDDVTNLINYGLSTYTEALAYATNLGHNGLDL